MSVGCTVSDVSYYMYIKGTALPNVISCRDLGVLLTLLLLSFTAMVGRCICLFFDFPVPLRSFGLVCGRALHITYYLGTVAVVVGYFPGAMELKPKQYINQPKLL